MNKNKKSILKKAMGKYKGKGGPDYGTRQMTGAMQGKNIADKIKSMREDDDSHMRIGSGSTKSPSPFGMIGGAIKGMMTSGANKLGQIVKDRIQVQKNFENRPNNKKYYGSNKDFSNK